MKAVFTAMAAASFFADSAIAFPGGAPAVSALCAALALALAPDFAARFAVPILFTPDVTAAADPLSPDARIIANGAAAAFALAAARARPARLLVSRIPGFDAELRLNASAARIEAEVFKGGKSVSRAAVKMRALIAAPRSPAVFRIDGAGGANALLIANPDASWRSPHPAAPPRAGFAIPALASAIIIANLRRVALI